MGQRAFFAGAGVGGGFWDGFFGVPGVGFFEGGRGGFLWDFDAFGEGWAGYGEIYEAFDFVDGDDAEGKLHAEGETASVKGGPSHVVGFEAPVGVAGEVFAFDDAADVHFWDFDHEAHGTDIGDDAVEGGFFAEVFGLVGGGDEFEVFDEFDLFGL